MINHMETTQLVISLADHDVDAIEVGVPEEEHLKEREEQRELDDFH